MQSVLSARISERMTRRGHIPDASVRGERLRKLRKGLGLSQENLIVASAEAAKALGPGYRPLQRSNYSALENGRGSLTLDAQRAVICVATGITRDELAAYLDGRLSLRDLIRVRAEREQAGEGYRGLPQKRRRAA